MVDIIDPPVGFKELTLCGSGATSRVYRAREVRSGRVVALKRLHRHLVRDGEALARLRRELEALGKIRHPGIVALHDLISWQGDPTLVMEFVEGEDLKVRLGRRGGLDGQEVERIARALLDIMAIAHGSGIVHRDVKPQNIRLAADGRICLLDFGSARLDATSQLTRTGSTVGTPDYMAPELFVASVYDPRVDLYGLGATLFECLTRRPPHTADSLAELAQLRATSAAPRVESIARDTPAALARLIDRCLAREPEDRYSSAALALWSLDHPELAAAYLAHRTGGPPCLHCGDAIPEQSRICPSCRSKRPFAYSAGPASVVVRGIQAPQRFIDHVVAYFPERANVDQIHSLTERCVAVEAVPQRYVSFVKTSEARAVAGRLRALGAHADVILETRLGTPLLLLGLLFTVALVAGGHPGLAALAPLAAVVIDRGRLLRAASGSILSTTRGSVAVAPSLERIGELAAILGALWLVVHGATDRSLPSVTWGLGALAAGLGVLIGSWLLSLDRPGLEASCSPMPAWPEQLWQSLRARPSTGASPSNDRGSVAASRGGVAMTLCCVVVVESFALAAGAQLDTVVTLPPEPVVEVPIKKPAMALDAPVTAASARWQKPACAIPIAPQPWRIPPGLWLPGSVVLLALPILHRRRRRIRDQAARLFSRLDLASLADAATRVCPSSRGCGDGRLADRIAARPSRDAFVAAATRRAAELAHFLPTEGVEQLTSALDALANGRRQAATAERSLLARCVLETDPELQTRFAFLALEGQLEAAAATEWARRVS